MALRQATPTVRDGGEGLARLIARYTRAGYITVLAIYVVLFAATGWLLSEVEQRVRRDATEAASEVMKSARQALMLWADIRLRESAALANANPLQSFVEHSPDSRAGTRQASMLKSWLGPRVAAFGGRGFALVSADGVVLAASANVGNDEGSALYRERHKRFTRVLQGELLFFSSFSGGTDTESLLHRVGTSAATAVLGLPVANSDGVIVAVLLIDFDVSKVVQRIVEAGKTGAGGRTYVFDRDGWFIKSAGMAKRPEATRADSHASQADDRRLRAPDGSLTHMAREALAGRAGSGVDGYPDVHGVRVVGAWRWDDTLDLGVAREIDEQRALAPYWSVRRFVLIILAISILLSLSLIYLLLRFRNRVEYLSRISSLDPLTHLANRRRFDVELGEQWQTASRSGLPISLIIIDVDCFKAYNDHYGHQAGDACLRDVAKTLAACVKRSQDLVVRYGGEEFAVLLPMTTRDSALIIAEHIKARIAALGIEHLASSVSGYITVSMGVATMGAEANTDAKVLVETADRYLYRAKETGRDRIVNGELN
jgi:diguanylate cyclase (GGDEF)-like protein